LEPPALATVGAVRWGRSVRHRRGNLKGSGKAPTPRLGHVLHGCATEVARIAAVTTPVQAQFSDSWWNDPGSDEDRQPGGMGLWMLIVGLSMAPGLGVLLTVLLD